MTAPVVLDPESPAGPSFVSGAVHHVRVAAKVWTPVLIDMDGYNVVNAHNLGILAELAYRGGWGQTLSRGGWSTDETSAPIIAEALRPLAERSASREAVGSALDLSADPVLHRVEAAQALDAVTARFFSNPGHSQAYGVAGGSHAVLGFRGSESPLSSGVVDWIRNANFVGVPYDWDGPGEIHQGFYEGFVGIRSQVDAFLSQFWAEGTPVFICGHSLGGALATVAASYVRARWRARVVLYTYASPHVGSVQFARHFSSDGDLAAHRHVLHSDIVPRLPPTELEIPSGSREAVEQLTKAPALFVDADLDPWEHVGTLRLLEHIAENVVVSRQLGTSAGPMPPPGGASTRSPDAIGWQMGGWGALATYAEVIESVYGELQSQADQAVGAVRDLARSAADGVEATTHYGLDHKMGAYQEVLTHQLREAVCHYLGLAAPSQAAAQTHDRWRQAQAAAQRDADDADARERGAHAEALRLRADAYDARHPDRDRRPETAVDNTAVVRPNPPVWVLERRVPEPPQIHAPGGRVAPAAPPQRLSDLVAQHEREQSALRERRAAAFEREALVYDHAANAYAQAADDARRRRDEARAAAEGALRQHGAVRGYDPIEGLDEELARHTGRPGEIAGPPAPPDP